MKVVKAVLALLVALALYLLFWPTGMTPIAWTAPPAPAPESAPHATLDGIQRLAQDVGRGPAAINVDATGRLYAGYRDGRVVQLSPDGATYMEWADTGGRPLGITFAPEGGLVVADAEKGLLHLGDELAPLTADGASAFIADADNTRLDKYIYFSEASGKFRYGDCKDLLEHGANGRLLRRDMATGETQPLMSGLYFPHGVAVGPDDAYVLVAETAAYRILRFWLKGEKAGTSDVFADHLPGFAANLSYNDRDRFWVALEAPRDARLDELLTGHFFARHLLSRLPVLPRERQALVLALDLTGKVIATLQDTGPGAYAPISSVREFGPWLYFGSPAAPAIGRLPLNRVVADAAAPPAGWQQVPASRELRRPVNREREEERERRR